MKLSAYCPSLLFLPNCDPWADNAGRLKVLRELKNLGSVIMKAFIKASEVWSPNANTMELEFANGDYGEMLEFKSVSERTVFKFDEGLPGKAWSQARPIILNKLDGSYFKRQAAAEAAGITSAIALPIFAGQYLQAVLVLLCGDDEAVAGAIELWHCDNKNSFDMNLLDGYFGQLDHFEFLSRHTAFRKGIGLPGLVWESGMPKIMPDLGLSHRFIRSKGATEAGITTGLGIPFFYDRDQSYVMTFLSALGTPIAPQMELWGPTYDGSGLMFLSGHCENNFDLNEQYSNVKIHKAEGILGRTLLTGMPCITTNIEEVQFKQNIAAKEFHRSSLITFPVIQDGWCKCVVALYG